MGNRDSPWWRTVTLPFLHHCARVSDRFYFITDVKSSYKPIIEYADPIWICVFNYTRSPLASANECYVIADVQGQGGSGDNGTFQSIAIGKITVPAALWKVIVVLPTGANDLQRINAQTRVIAVWTPNNNQVGEQKWIDYRVSVDEIEQKTRYDLLSNLSIEIQAAIEKRKDEMVVQSVWLTKSL